MPTAFVPLLQKSTPADSDSASRGFQKLQSRSTEPASVNSPTTDAPANAHAAQMSPGADGHGKPTIQCDRDGERITRIRVTCGCGEVIEIDCSYETPPQPKDAHYPNV